MSDLSDNVSLDQWFSSLSEKERKALISELISGRRNLQNVNNQNLYDEFVKKVDDKYHQLKSTIQ